jgi:glycosyltransferase involved in cell wall biosynthesis
MIEPLLDWLRRLSDPLRNTTQIGRWIARLPAGDVAAWRAAIQSLAGDPARVRRMGQAARERAVAQFTWAQNAARHEALLGGQR